jgi:hypothetical protein
LSSRPSKQWRAPAGTAILPTGASYTAGDPLDRPIADREVFFGTIAHAAALAGIDPEHLATSIRLGAVPGEVATARRIHDAAAALSGAGYSARPPAPRGPSIDAATVASDLASLGTRGAALRGRKRGERAPREARTRAPRAA